MDKSVKSRMFRTGENLSSQVHWMSRVGVFGNSRAALGDNPAKCRLVHLRASGLSGNIQWSFIKGTPRVGMHGRRSTRHGSSHLDRYGYALVEIKLVPRGSGS